MADAGASHHGPPASSSSLPVVGLTTPISELARKLRDERLSAVVVSDNGGGAVSGIVTERDICKSVLVSSEFDVTSLTRRFPNQPCTAGDIMTADPICALQSCPPEKVISIMLTRNFRHLPVVDDRRALVQVLDILTIAKVITAEIARRQREAEMEQERSLGLGNWFAKAIGAINKFFAQSTFFSKRSILTLMDEAR